MSRPSITVTISNYNHAHFLPDALAAILSQSYPAAEVLIVDDASTDDSIEVIHQFAKVYSNVRLIRNDRNRGAVHNAQVLFGLATGDYIYSTASDDRVLPGFFEKSIAVLAQFPNAGLCFSDPATFVETHGPIRDNRMELASKPRYFEPQELLSMLRRRSVEIAGHTSLMKRKLFLECGGLIPSLKWHCDWFGLWVLAFRYGACYVPEPLATLRVLPQSYSASGRRNQGQQIEIVTEMLRLLRGPYKDVAPMFKAGGLFWTFKTAAIYAALSNPKYWSEFDLIWVKKLISSIAIRSRAGRSMTGDV
jgi:glycosyltransferase involved in cell wall biosynthesis